MARGRGRTIDFKEWRLLAGASQSISTDGTRLGSAVLGFDAPGTILRVRTPDILFSFDQTQQVGDSMILGLGLALMSSDAVAAGATAFPDPATEFEYPWLWWGQWQLRSTVAAGINNLGTSVIRTSADTKAMRRFKPSMSLLWVVEATGTTGAVVTSIDVGSSRVLIGT